MQLIFVFNAQANGKIGSKLRGTIWVTEVVGRPIQLVLAYVMLLMLEMYVPLIFD